MTKFRFDFYKDANMGCYGFTRLLQNVFDVHVIDPCWVVATNEDTDEKTAITTTDQLEAFRIGLERAAAWVPEKSKKDHINPSHYKGFFVIPEMQFELQWLEHIQYLPRFRNPECMKAAVEIQIRKYLDRLGGKDSELQELKKSIWYAKFLAAYIANGNKPIRIADIDKLLA